MSKDRNEIEYEAPAIDYETPKKKKREKPTVVNQEGIAAFLKELGGCWCGRAVPGCDGSGSRVTNLWGKHYNYTCPNGKNNTSVNSTIRQAAVNAGLVKEEPNG